MKKYTLILFLLMLIAQSVSAMRVVSEVDAVNIVKNKFGLVGDKYDYYIVLDNNKNYWTVFVDADPMKLWEHDCFTYQVARTVLDGTNIAPVHEEKRLMPPSYEIKPISVKNSKIPSVKKIRIPVSTFGNCDASNRTYAVILGGCNNESMLEVTFWNDCSFIYQALVKKFGIPKDNIFPLISDGTDPALDMFIRGSEEPPTSHSLDLDFDGEDEMQLACTHGNIESVFKAISNRIQKNDLLFVFAIGHGGGSASDLSSLHIYKNHEYDHSLYDYEFANLLRDNFLGKGVNINIVMGQCYSGGFIDDIVKVGLESCVIATSASSTEPAGYSDDMSHSEFLYKWTCAVNEATDSMTTVHSDLDNDGRVTMKEAFDYAKEHDCSFDTPQYFSTPKSLGNSLAFNYVPVDFDLCIENKVNEDSGMFWNTPSMWVCKNKETMGHENVYCTSDNEKLHINVRIHNRGNSDYDGLFKWCHLYWAKASTATNSSVWQGTEPYYNTISGGYITSVKIPAIASGDSAVINYEWLASADLFRSYPLESDSEPHHLTILAKITDSKNVYSDDMDFDVKTNNEIAQKNEIIINSNDNNKKFSFFVRNISDETKKYNLELRPRTLADAELLEQANVQLFMSPKRYYAWIGDSIEHEIIFPLNEIVGNNTMSYSYNLNNTELKDLSLESGEYDKFSIKVSFTGLVVLDGRTFTFDLLQKEKDGRIVGGVTFIVKRSGSSLSPLVIGQNVLPSGEYELFVDNSYESYTWTDAENNVIGTTSSIVFNPLSEMEEIKVSAINYSGELSTGQILINKLNGIKSADPLANVRDEINVEFYDEVGENSLFAIISVVDGSIVLMQDIDSRSKDAVVDTASLKSGMYILSYIANGEKLSSLKFSKR